VGGPGLEAVEEPTPGDFTPAAAITALALALSMASAEARTPEWV